MSHISKMVLSIVKFGGPTATATANRASQRRIPSGLGATTMATCARRPSLARIGAGPGRRGRPESGLWWTSGGLEPCRCSRPVRDAAPTIFCNDRLAADAGPGRRRSQLPQIRPDALDAGETETVVSV